MVVPILALQVVVLLVVMVFMTPEMVLILVVLLVVLWVEKVFVMGEMALPMEVVFTLAVVLMMLEGDGTGTSDSHGGASGGDAPFHGDSTHTGSGPHGGPFGGVSGGALCGGGRGINGILNVASDEIGPLGGGGLGLGGLGNPGGGWLSLSAINSGGGGNGVGGQILSGGGGDLNFGASVHGGGASGSGCNQQGRAQGSG